MGKCVARSSREGNPRNRLNGDENFQNCGGFVEGEEEGRDK